MLDKIKPLTVCRNDSQDIFLCIRETINLRDPLESTTLVDTDYGRYKQAMNGSAVSSWLELRVVLGVDNY